ncbi:MAG: hypothetical protein LGR52_10335 [Candidatus Thiosymbion ectosymbiont of Robbea hypermnestra]|nr:hypothetical protein [Candidatus Thiosymbion ectosymbiont of Robbea hypermnestra]
MFVTRRDLAAALEAVRFGDPASHFLDRVEPAYIETLLEELTAPPGDDQPVISHPNAGWHALRRRLIGDLSAQGGVLPIRARVAFRGLTKLPVLRVAAYERRGGIEGLEAAYIEDAADAAARAAGVSGNRVLTLLLGLVDETDAKVPKARAAPEVELAGAAGLDPAQGDRVLSLLGQKGVARRRVGDGADPSPVWSLYHDYLAWAVLAAYRRAHRWQRLLRERRRALREAGTWTSRWRALLSPWEQPRLLGATLVGRVRWAGYRGFAMLSSLRLLPLLLALGLTWIGAEQARDWQDRQAAQPILSAIRGGAYNHQPAGEEYRSLWELASARPGRKWAFLAESLPDTQSHPDLRERLEPVAQSLFGLDPDHRLRRQALDRILDQGPKTPYQAGLAALIHRSAPRIFGPRASRIATAIAILMRTIEDPKSLSQLGEALGQLGEQLPAEQAQAIAVRLVAAMNATTDSDQLSALGEALGQLGERLSAKQAQVIAVRLVELMNATIDSDQLGALGGTLGSLGGRLPAEPAQAVALRLVETMKATTDWDQLHQLGEALGGLGKRLPAEPAQAVASRLMETMKATTDLWRLSWLGEALGSLGERLPAEQAQAAALHLVEAMNATTNSDQLSALSEALGSLGERLPAEQAQAAVLRLVAAMNATTDSDDLDAEDDSDPFSQLSEALGQLGERLPAAAQAVAVPLVESMKATTDWWQLSQFGKVLGSLGERLPAEQAQAAASRLVAIMGSPIDSYGFASLAATLGKLPVTKDMAGMDTAADLLQAPMAYGETREQLLRYYGRLAGVFGTPEAFETTDDLVAWARKHRPSLDLDRPPRNPFQW